MNLEKLVTVKKIPNDQKIADIIFVDIKNDAYKIDVFSKKITIDKKIDDDKIKKELFEYIDKLSINDDNDILNKFSISTIDGEINETFKRKVITKISNASYYIATSGRIGQANTILMSEETEKKYEIKKYIDDDFDIEFVFDDSIKDIYMYRKNEIDQPGLVLIMNDDVYEIIDIGFYPYRQFMKIMI